MVREHDSTDFEDDRGSLNKERRCRNHVLRIFNKRRDDFASEEAFDDYLEEVEDLVFNLTNDVDVDATKAKINVYKRENQDTIGRNQAKRMDERQRAAELLAISERARVAELAALRQADAAVEEAARARRREREVEELQRASLGEREAERLKKEKERKAKKERRRAERDAEDAARARAKAAELDTKPMYFRPAFPNPPPQVVSDVAAPGGCAFDAVTRASAGGWVKAMEEERALKEFRDGLCF